MQLWLHSQQRDHRQHIRCGHDREDSLHAADPFEQREEDRANDGRAAEYNGVQRYRAGELTLVDDRGHHCRPRRYIERQHNAGPRGDCDEDPFIHRVGCDKCGGDEPRCGEQQPCQLENAQPIQTIGQYSSPQGEHQDRDLRRGRHKPEHHLAVGQRTHQPQTAVDQRPHPNVRECGRYPEQTVLAESENRESGVSETQPS